MTEIRLGSVTGSHGIKGWVKVFSYTNPRDNILAFEHWYLIRESECYLLNSVKGRKQGKSLIVANIEGSDDRDIAQQLIDAEIWVQKEQLPALEKDEYYWSDLIGLEVLIGDVSIGKVSAMLETGANDVLVVKGDKERLIPFLQPDIVKNVDLANKHIVVDWDPDF